MLIRFLILFMLSIHTLQAMPDKETLAGVRSLTSTLTRYSRDEKSELQSGLGITQSMLDIQRSNLEKARSQAERGAIEETISFLTKRLDAYEYLLTQLSGPSE